MSETGRQMGYMFSVSDSCHAWGNIYSAAINDCLNFWLFTLLPHSKNTMGLNPTGAGPFCAEFLRSPCACPGFPPRTPVSPHPWNTHVRFVLQSVPLTRGTWWNLESVPGLAHTLLTAPSGWVKCRVPVSLRCALYDTWSIKDFFPNSKVDGGPQANSKLLLCWIVKMTQSPLNCLPGSHYEIMNNN